MSAINDGGPAFPTENEHQNSETTWHYRGMSLRDYFASSAMNGVISSCTQGQEITPSMCAKWCYEMADAMLKARKGGAS